MTRSKDSQRSDSFRKTTLVCGGFAAFTGILGSAGWMLHVRALTSFLPNYVPIALSTCIAFIVQGGILIGAIRFPRFVRRWPCLVPVAVTAGFGFLIAAKYIAGLGLMPPTTRLPARFLVDGMSPLAGCLFCLTGVALLVLLRLGTRRSVSAFVDCTAVLVAVVGLIGTMSYVHGVPLFYGGEFVPLALPTALAFIFLGAGLTAAAGPDGFVLKPFTGSSLRAMLLRTFVPLGFLAIIGSGILQQWITRLNSAFVSAASAVVVGLVTIAAVVQAARIIGDTIEKTENDRRRTEDALRESDKYLAKAQRIAHFGHWRLDPSTRLMEGSEEFFRILGINRSSMDFSEFADALDPDERIFVLGRIEQALAAHSPYDFEHWLVCGDGTRKFVNVIGEPVLDDRGNLVMLVGTIQDITERRRAEEERAILATAVEQAADGIIITNRRGDIEYVNPSFERVSGYGRLELIDRNFGVLRSDRHSDAFYKDMWNCISGGNNWSGHIVNKMKEGRICEFDTTISPIRDASGQIRNFVSVNRDVTREVKIQRQLRQAQKMEALGTLAGGIAHDFNNILGMILGYTEMALLETPTGSHLWSNLSQVPKAVDRAKDLVRQILAFSRQGEQKRGPIRIGPIVEEALKFMSRVLPSTIEVRQEIRAVPYGADIVVADPSQVHQILMNLVTNAAHAMRERGGVLEVKLSAVEFFAYDFACPADLKPGPYIRLAVSDTGQGIAPSALERIFEPYYTTKGPGEGTGLGLAVVHGIVISHEGAITVYSKPGDGSVFNVYLPRAESEASTTGSELLGLPRGNERVLFIDDEKDLAAVGGSMLEFLGYTVIAKSSALEALEVFRSQPDGFDLVITDMTMPAMTGLDLAEELLRIRPRLPIILCTGYSSIATPDKARAAGIRRILQKPLIMSVLSKAIRETLDEE